DDASGPEDRIDLRTSTLRVRLSLDGEPAPPGLRLVTARPTLAVVDDDDDGVWRLRGFQGRCVEVAVFDPEGVDFFGGYAPPAPLCFGETAVGDAVVDVRTADETIVFTDRLVAAFPRERRLRFDPASVDVRGVWLPLPPEPMVETTLRLAVGRHDIDLEYDRRGWTEGPGDTVERFTDVAVPSPTGTIRLAANEEDLALHLTHGGQPIGEPPGGSTHGWVLVQTPAGFGGVRIPVTGGELTSPVSALGVTSALFFCDETLLPSAEPPCVLEAAPDGVVFLLLNTHLRS
ncbi:MAG TPA: hypothetical protein RMF84_15385, partial [Polyangiaceae bacterium LLY-WYZ-14_1]|nr:hypothetical protein [Polyangiaceae bacterium LLY-WYZ-14_1]